MNVQHNTGAATDSGLSKSVELTVEQAIAEIRAGRQIILVDDEDRENEGDLCMAAEKVTPEAINFMAKFGRGLICLTMTGERIRRLGLPPMAAQNASRFGTNFHVGIEARTGVTTGISAADRARTIEAAVAVDADESSVVSPGHIFPIRAVDGGVLVRCGQTEGSVDLARLAGVEPAGVICEIMNDDGTMARRPALERFAKQHGMGILTIAQLIRHRLSRETLLKPVVETTGAPFGLQSAFRVVLFDGDAAGGQYLAFVLGDISKCDSTLVRIHRASLVNDVFEMARGESANKNRLALNMIEKEGAGVFLYVVPKQIDMAAQLHRYRDTGTFEGLSGCEQLPELREFGLGAQILRTLGVTKIRLMTDNPKRIVGLSGYGLEIMKQVSLHA